MASGVTRRHPETKRQIQSLVECQPSRARRLLASPVPGMSAKGLAPGTVKTRFVNVRSVFRAAMRDKVVASDPTEGVRLPRQRRAGAAMTIPTPADVRSILEAADERFRAFVAVCAFAGLRLGEAAALKVGDVDFLRRQISVSRQVQRENAV